jgi:molybdate transport system substrate-binding protein
MAKAINIKLVVLLTRLAIALGLMLGSAVQAAPLVVAAADLRLALTAVAAAFQQQTGQDVQLSFGSSGNFYRQLQQGAPFEMFLSADEHYVLELAKAGNTIDNGVLYAIGRLAIVAPKGSPLHLDGALAGLRQALHRGEITRFAIANPDHAPYGVRAEQVLRNAGLWPQMVDRLVIGENVAQALQFATVGGAQGGIVSYSLVRDPAFAARATYALIPAAAHAPLRQRMVLMKTAGPVARQFYAFMQAEAARQILVQYGFSPPGESR